MWQTAQTVHNTFSKQTWTLIIKTTTVKSNYVIVYLSSGVKTMLGIYKSTKYLDNLETWKNNYIRHKSREILSLKCV